jgi:excisionase family DNA binding protein
MFRKSTFYRITNNICYTINGKEVNKMAEALLTTQQAAQRLDVKVDTVQRYLRQGKIRAVRLGKFWRIPESALQNYTFNQQKHQPENNATRMQEFLKIADQLRPLILSGAGADFDVQAAIESN